MAPHWFKKNKEGTDKRHAEECAKPVGAETETNSDNLADVNPENFTKKTTAKVEGSESHTPPTKGEPAESGGMLRQLRRGLAKTRDLLTTDIEDLFVRRKKIDGDLLEDLEEILITSDIGVQTAMDLMERISGKATNIEDASGLKTILKDEILSILQEHDMADDKITARPHVIMVVGVNGVGKTTTIGKLAAKYSADGKKVLIAAADTFRAAAIEQLAIWAERAGADIVKHKNGADPAAVAFDGVQAASARGADVVLVDTAGRLHTKINLMGELKKIKRSISKKLPDAPHEILLVLDATTGQNALSQARMFDEVLDITGIALTKLDGTARGGIVVGIYSTLNIPLQYVGVGETIDDLQHFDPQQFVEALF